METKNIKNIRDFLIKAGPIIKTEKYQKLKDFIHHGRFSVYSHSLHVAYFCYLEALKKPKIDMDSLIKAALLHDYFLYDWHYRIHRHGLHGYTHPKVAFRKAMEDFGLTKKEANAILCHMWPLTIFDFPKSKEAWILCMMDKKSTNYETRYKTEKRQKLFKKKKKHILTDPKFLELLPNMKLITSKKKKYYYQGESDYGYFVSYRFLKNTYIYCGFKNDLPDEVKFETAALIMKYSKDKNAYIHIPKNNNLLCNYLLELVSEKDENYKYNVLDDDFYLKISLDRRKK